MTRTKPKTLANACVHSLRPTVSLCRPAASSRPTALCTSLTLSPISSILSCLAASVISRWSVVSVARRAVRSCSVEFETPCSVVWQREPRAERESKVEYESGNGSPSRKRSRDAKKSISTLSKRYQNKYSRDSPFVTCKILRERFQNDNKIGTCGGWWVH